MEFKIGVFREVAYRVKHSGLGKYKSANDKLVILLCTTDGGNIQGQGRH